MISDYFLPFDYSLDRYCSIIHSRLRLDTCALFYYLFKLQFYFLLFVVVVLIKRLNLIFFLHCPKYASPRKKSLSAVARFFLTNGRDTRTLKTWTFSYLAPLIYQRVQTLLFFNCFNFLSKEIRKTFLTALFTCDVICMLYVKCGCKPSRWALHWALGANMY